jgi:hypothetical protein
MIRQRAIARRVVAIVIRSSARKIPYGLAGQGMTKAWPSSTLRPLETMTGINARGRPVV